jgi:prepilin-type N-terminal cleavage/methylation domain-containing protein
MTVWRPVREGFTLVEVLVALAIFALAGRCPDLPTKRARRRQGRAERLRTATLLAQSLIDRVGSDLPHAPLSRGEAPPGFTWQVETQILDATQVESTLSLRPVSIRVTVRWTEHLREQSIILSTLRLANVPTP